MTQENTKHKDGHTVSSLSSSELLAAWRKYSENPQAMHPCENFKAGWVAANLTNDEDAICNTSSIKEGCRDFRC